MEPITFYRRMANSNIILMKKYKYNQIKKLSYDNIIEIYKTNNIDFDLDVIRLKKFNIGDSRKDNNIEDINIPKIESENIINNEDNNIEDINIPKIESEDIINNEDNNIEDINIPKIEPENIINNKDDNIFQTEEVNQLVNTEDETISANINQELSEEQIEYTNYIEENSKIDDNNFNMYYALISILLLVFFLFVKK
jgi:hypothetical protein